MFESSLGHFLLSYAGAICRTGIEMGEPGGHVDDPERWVKESPNYLEGVLPEVTR